MPSSIPNSRFYGWIVAAAAGLVLFVQLGAPALWDDDEPKNSACSLAMLDAHDWVVPTFNGNLRIEKPPLVNWVQMAGFTLCGRNETGARIGSALLTLATCLLTWRIGCELLGPMVGLWGGLAMATCVWTAVGGRAATPDAPLLFLTTLSLFFFVRGWSMNRSGPLTNGPPLKASLPLVSAILIGASCGAAVLAKGPVGIVLPLAAFGLFVCWQGSTELTRSQRVGWQDLFFNGVAILRQCLVPTGVIVITALCVAVPWYGWVGLRTDGEWLRGFLLVHNVGRFAGTMEGHSGSVFYYPITIAVGFFPWSIVLAAMLTHGFFILRDDQQPPPVSQSPHQSRQWPLRLLACWAIAWVGAFSCSGTKLPGYVWPAYPAIALAIGLFLDDWTQGNAIGMRWCPNPANSLALVMRLAWSILAITGAAIVIGLPLASERFAPGAQWLGAVGLIPIAAAVVAWRYQSMHQPHRALAALAVSACLLVTLLASVGAQRVSHSTGTRAMLAELSEPVENCKWACFWNIPPSLVFYAQSRVEKLDTADDVAAHLRASPQAHVVIDSRHEPLVASGIPAGYGVLSRTKTLADYELVLIGPLSDPTHSLVKTTPPAAD